MSMQFTVAQAIKYLKSITRNGDGIIRSTAYYAVEDDVEEEPLLFFSGGVGLQDIPQKDEQWLSELSIHAEDACYTMQFYGGFLTHFYESERPDLTIEVEVDDYDYDEVIEIDAD